MQRKKYSAFYSANSSARYSNVRNYSNSTLLHPNSLGKPAEVFNFVKKPNITRKCPPKRFSQEESGRDLAFRNSRLATTPSRHCLGNDSCQSQASPKQTSCPDKPGRAKLRTACPNKTYNLFIRNESNILAPHYKNNAYARHNKRTLRLVRNRRAVCEIPR